MCRRPCGVARRGVENWPGRVVETVRNVEGGASGVGCGKRDKTAT